MTPALAVPTESSRAQELVRRFHERLTEAMDGAAAAALACELLSAGAPAAAVCVFHYDPLSEAAVLLAAPQRASGPAVGTRVILEKGLMATALRSGAPQRVIDSYADPDFGTAHPESTRSYLVVPIGPAGSGCGVLRLEYPSPHHPRSEDQLAAAALAAELADRLPFPASDPREATAGAAPRLRQLAVLADTAAYLAQSSDLGRGIQRATESALALVECEGAALLLRHTGRPMLEVAAVAGRSGLTAGELLPVDGHFVGAVLEAGQPRTWPSPSSPLTLIGGQRVLADVRDALVVPLVAGGRPFGAVAVVNRRDGRGFGPDDVAALQHLANQAACIESVRLLQPLRQQLSDSSIIAEVGRAVTGTLGLDEVLGLVVRAAEMLADGQGAAVALTTPGGDALILESTPGSLMRRQGEELPLQESFVGSVVRSAEPVISARLAEDPRAAEAEKVPAAAVAVPIESRNRVYGALFAVRRAKAPAPSHEDVDALRKLAAYAAIAIDNARLYREQLELSTALRAQTAELEKAYSDLRDSQERLVVSEKMAALGRVTAGIAHEINSPLGGILNCLQMSQAYVAEYRSSIGDPEVTVEDHLAIASDLRESIDLAEHSARKVAQFVRTIKNQTRVGTEAQRGVFDPADEVHGVVSLLQHELRNRHVELHVEVQPGHKLMGDPGKFGLVLQNLVTNAIDAYEQKAGEVWVRLFSAERGLVLEVEDHGCGIPEEIRGKIYDYLFTTKDIGQGTGLGLAMVHSTVTTQFDGEIEFTTALGVGTTFRVILPVLPERA